MPVNPAHIDEVVAAFKEHLVSRYALPPEILRVTYGYVGEEIGMHVRFIGGRLPDGEIEQLQLVEGAYVHGGGVFPVEFASYEHCAVFQ